MSAFDFTLRSTESERMDSCDFSGPELHRALLDIERFNLWLGGHRAVIRGVQRVLGWLPNRPLKIVDIGCGSGDVLRRLATWSSANGIAVELYGVDANPEVIAIARNRSLATPSIHYVVGDAFGDTLSTLKPDVIVANQFFHHFTSSALSSHLPALLCHTRALVIADLHRSPIAVSGFGFLAKLFRASPVALYDGQVSIRRAFTRHELEQLILPLSLRYASIRWSFPFRFEVVLVP